MRPAHYPVRLLFSLLCIGLFAGGTARPDPEPASTAAPSLRALLVGGGPDPSHNQVAIESNVRYVSRLLPPTAFTQTLFADGNPKTANVLYLNKSGDEKFRASILPVIDGPCRADSFDSAFQKIAASPGSPLLLYFTGHGSPNEESRDEDNYYDMWGGDQLTVRKLGSSIATLSPGTQVTLVMVECFSGAFGNLIFTGGDPQGDPTDKDLCGFFASVSSQPAAGCTPEVNEADYHDFTSYFFAALSGTDRLGHPVHGADYDHNGKVGMDEAFAYTLIHDVSIDTPVCTSDVFLRRFVLTPDAAIFKTSYANVSHWATSAQHAALEGLSAQLHLHGDSRLGSAYLMFSHRLDQNSDTDADEVETARWVRFVRLAKSIVLAHTLRASGDPILQKRFQMLLIAESRNPLHPSR